MDTPWTKGKERVDVHAFLHQMGLDGEKSDCGSMEEAPPLSHRPHGSIMEEREDEFEGESDTDDNEEGDFEYNTDMSAIDDWHCLMNDHDFCMLMETIKKKNGARQEAAALRLEARQPTTTALPLPPQPPARTTFAVDPVTHSRFTSMGRGRALCAEEARNVAAGNNYAALQLLFGSVVPAGHTIPYCIVRVPGNFTCAGAAEVLSFDACYSAVSIYKPPRGDAIAGKWSRCSTQLHAAKALIFCCGLDLQPLEELCGGVVAKMAVPDIKDELKARGLDTSGAKGIVAGRLRISIASDSARARVYTGRKLTACAQTRLLELAPPHFLTLGVPRVL